MGNFDILDVSFRLADELAKMASFRNSYYNRLEEIYRSGLAQDFLFQNTLIVEAAEEASKDAFRNLDAVQDYYEASWSNTTDPQKDILCMMETWWKLFMQEIEQNQLIAKRFIAKQKDGTPYSLFSQFADKKRGKELNKEEDKLLKAIGLAVEKYGL